MPSEFTRPHGVSRLGFGTWQFGGDNQVNGMPAGWGFTDEGKAIEAVHFALDNGITFFDTADTYGRGQSERILGRAFSSYKGSARPVVCTKFGNQELPDGSFVKNYSGTYLRECVLNSLERLQVEKLEMVLLHSPDDNFDWIGYDAGPFRLLVEEGLVHRFGVSSRSVYGAERVLEAGFGSVIEMTFNVLDRRAEELLFCHPQAEHYSFIARVPLASGFITSGILKVDPAFNKDDYRSMMNARDVEWLTGNVRKLAFLEEEPGGISLSALRYVLGKKEVDYVIPGMRSAARVAANLQAVELGPLHPVQLAEIQKAVPDVPDWWKPKS